MSKPKLLKVRHMSRPKAFYLGPPIFLFETGIFACAWLPHKCPTKKKKSSWDPPTHTHTHTCILYHETPTSRRQVNITLAKHVYQGFLIPIDEEKSIGNNYMSNKVTHGMVTQIYIQIYTHSSKKLTISSNLVMDISKTRSIYKSHAMNIECRHIYFQETSHHQHTTKPTIKR